MILGAHGQPLVTLGGKFARSVYRRGELAQAFQYINTEPAIVIWSLTRRGGAFAMCLSAAHQYLDDEYCVAQAMQCAATIGYSPRDRSVVNKIIDLFLDGLDELVHMPPEPTAAEREREQRAEVTLKLGGETISEREVFHDPLATMQ
jgi:hypothetical protein